MTNQSTLCDFRPDKSFLLCDALQPYSSQRPGASYCDEAVERIAINKSLADWLTV